MTRYARVGIDKKEHDATSWENFKKQKRKLKEQGDQPSKKKTDKVPEWLEKRREARRMRRKKGKPCFHCRQPGHKVSECPQRFDEEQDSSVCFKCGSSEHTVHECKVKVKDGEYPFAKCFICKETGHLSNKCAQNPRGLYPDGGGCRFCGSVEHYRRDCPERECNKNQNTKKPKLKTMTKNQSIDAIDENSDNESEYGIINEPVKKKKKVIKF